MSVLWLYDARLALLATVFVPLLVASALIHQSDTDVADDLIRRVAGLTGVTGRLR